MPAVCDTLLQHQLHQFLGGRGHVLKTLPEGNDREPHALKILHHLYGTPAVESNLADIEPFTQPFNEFFNVTVVNHIALSRL